MYCRKQKYICIIYIYTEVFTQYFLNDSSLWCIVSLYKTYYTPQVLSIFSPVSISSVSQCSSEQPLKALQRANAQLLCWAIGQLRECHVRSSAAFPPTQFRVSSSVLEKPEVVGRLVLGHVWDYHTCQHTFKKTSTSSCSLMFCVTY